MANEQGLWQNKLFLQMLGAAGQDISAGNPIGANVNKAMEQNMQNENMRNVLVAMLGDKSVPGGSATVDDKTLTLKYPATMFAEDPMGGGETIGEGTEGAFSTDFSKSTPTPAPSKGDSAMLNPFASALSSLSASDMVGLTPEMMVTALGIGMGRETTAADLRYKEALIEQAEAVAEKTRRPEKVKKPTSIQEYEYAVEQGAFDGSYTDWKKDKTNSEREYLAAVESGYKGPYHEWYVQMKKAGATRISIGEEVDKKIELDKVSGQSYFANPAKRQKDLDAYIASDEFQDLLFDANPDDVDKFTSDAKITWLENRIVSGGGIIKKREESADGKIVYWTVDWEVGKPTEVRHVR